MLRESNKKEKKEDAHKLAMLKYIRSPKGIMTRQRYKDNHKEESKMYFSSYMRQKRELAKKNKICIKCFKAKVEDGKVQCSPCLAKQREYHSDRLRNVEKKTLWQWFNFHQK